MVFTVSGFLGCDPLAENTGWTEEQDHDQHGEGDGILELIRTWIPSLKEEDGRLTNMPSTDLLPLRRMLPMP
jgi:hypothetical protein